MDKKFPIKRLNRLSSLVALAIGTIIYIILTKAGEKNGLFFALEAAISISLIGRADTLAILLLSKRFTYREKKFSLYRNVSTYLFAVALYLCTWPIFAHFANYSWSLSDGELWLALLSTAFVINTMIFIMHDSILLQEMKMWNELEFSKLKTAYAEAENLRLRQQIQPHFLFNALDNLKALYNLDQVQGDSYVVHMADFLRASITHSNETITLLREEITLLKDYLAMQQIRFGTALECNIEIALEVQEAYYLPSFCLQPLIENAIKHNNFTKKKPLKIDVIQNNEWVVIRNNLQKKTIKLPSTNYGLANLAERHRICAGEELIITETENTFSVSIKLMKQ